MADKKKATVGQAVKSNVEKRTRKKWLTKERPAEKGKAVAEKVKVETRKTGQEMIKKSTAQKRKSENDTPERKSKKKRSKKMIEMIEE